VFNLGAGSKAVVVSAAVGAGTSAVNGAVVDSRGYESVAYFAQLGDCTVGATLQLKLQASGSDTTALADVTGAATDVFTADATSADEKIVLLDIVKPIPGKYNQRPVLVRGVANSIVKAIIAVLYNPKTAPAAAGDVVASKTFAG
jgi:sugar/nucleoside kinase (ribokinase family)